VVGMVKEEPRSNFLLVKCEKCKNEQIVFDSPASVVKCLVCGNVLAKSTGGKGEFTTKILKRLE